MNPYFTLKWPSLAILFSSLILTACNTTDSSSEIGNTGIKNTSGQITELDLAIAEVLIFNVIPAMENFNTQAQELDNKVKELCPTSENKMTEPGLVALQNQWKSLNNAWYSALPFLLGPLEVPADDLGLTPTYAYIDSFRIDYINRTSSVRNRISASLNDVNFDETSIETYTYQRTGLLPLEILLFERSSDNTQINSTIVDEYMVTTKCSLLRGHSNLVSNFSEEIVTGWKSNYRDTGIGYAELFINNTLDYYFDDNLDGSGEISTTRYITALKNHFEYLANRNIHTSSAVLAGSYWDAISSTVVSAEATFSGTDKASLSIYSFMSVTGNNDNVSRITPGFSALMTTVENQIVVDMQAAALSLHDIIETDVTSAFNVSLGLNFSDGD